MSSGDGYRFGRGARACHYRGRRDKEPARCLPRRISARVAAIAESATLAVDAKAKALKAAGEPVIGFGAGEPDFPTPQHIVEAAVEACRMPRFHKYTPAGGLPEREAIAAKTKRDSGYDVSASQVLVTNGGKHAVYNTFQPRCSIRATRCCCRRRTGRPTPSPSAWPGACRWCCPPTRPPASGSPSTSWRRRSPTAPRCCVFVSPSNPTGVVYPAAEVEAIGRWAAEQGHLGHHRRDLRAPHLRRPRVHLDRRAGARAGRPGASCSTGSPRPTP